MNVLGFFLLSSKTRILTGFFFCVCVCGAEPSLKKRFETIATLSVYVLEFVGYDDSPVRNFRSQLKQLD